MSALGETAAAGRAGKSTRGSSRLSVGDATRTLSLPQAPYGDAVHAALLAVGMPPEALEVALRKVRAGSPELVMRAVWPAGSPVLDERVCGLGLTLAWSHVTGWAAFDAEDSCQLLGVDTLADPRSIAHAALHFAEEPVTGEPWTPVPGSGRWSEAVYLDIALGLFDENGGPSW